MDVHAVDYYRPYSEQHPDGHFHKVIPLHEAPDIDWKEISKQVPTLPRGWYELSRLSKEDRRDFTRDFWISKMPYHAKFTEFLVSFFESLDDIGVFIVQRKFEDPFEVHLVYSLSEDGGFFHGDIPAASDEILLMQKEFINYSFPLDYVAFLEIHNGFAKWTDTGITKIGKLKESYQAFQTMLANEEPLYTSKKEQIDPKTLIPFYESFGMPFFQCFWAEWYPEEEMGNVYYSGLTKSISDVHCADCSTETMAFPTFTDWFMFYLEKVD